MVQRSISDYLQFDVVTQIRVFKEVPVEYPTITICNINPLTTKEAAKRLNESYERWYEKISTTIDYSLLDGYINTFQYETKYPSYGDVERKKLGPDISEMLINCVFASLSCTYLNLDGQKFWVDFSWIYTTNYGNCFRFNAGLDTFGNKVPLKKVDKEGKYSELEMDLFLLEHKDIPNLNSNRGFRIFVENSSDVASTFDGGIDIKPGTLSELNIRKLVTQRKPFPYGDCQEEYPEDFIYDKYRENKTPYKQKDCFTLCIQKAIIMKCNCSNLIYDEIDERIPPCDFRSDCLNNFCTPYSIYSLPNTLARSCNNEQANAECSSICNLECESISYDITPSFTDFPSERSLEKNYMNSYFIKENFRKENTTNITKEQLRSKIAKVKILFNDLSYTKISEAEKTELVDLVANVGGIQKLK